MFPQVPCSLLRFYSIFFHIFVFKESIQADDYYCCLFWIELVAGRGHNLSADPNTTSYLNFKTFSALLWNSFGLCLPTLGCSSTLIQMFDSFLLAWNDLITSCICDFLWNVKLSWSLNLSALIFEEIRCSFYPYSAFSFPSYAIQKEQSGSAKVIWQAVQFSGRRNCQLGYSSPIWFFLCWFEVHGRRF